VSGFLVSLGGVDLVEHAAVVEVGLLDAWPVAEGPGHAEEADLGEAVGVLGEDFLVARAQVVVGGDALALVGPQVLQVGLGLGASAFPANLISPYGINKSLFILFNSLCS
jgi:hypothetical protein